MVISGTLWSAVVTNGHAWSRPIESQKRPGARAFVPDVMGIRAAKGRYTGQKKCQCPVRALADERRCRLRGKSFLNRVVQFESHAPFGAKVLLNRGAHVKRTKFVVGK
jgi:hypothetical protein